MMYFRWLDLTPDPGWGFLTPVPSLSTITTTLKLLILSYRYQFNKGPIIELIKILHLKFIWYRGYYTLARRYEFYVRVARTISHEWAQRTSGILFSPRQHKYMLFAGWEVRIGKNCDRGLENAARGRRPRAAFSSPRSQFFPIRTDPKPANNLFIFFTVPNLAIWLVLSAVQIFLSLTTVTVRAGNSAGEIVMFS